MADVLNQTLYAALSRAFGRVRVSNQGVAAAGPQYSGGEYYCVCCPQCGDRRYRLFVSYLYGTADRSGNVRTHLYHCFNEGCEKNGLDLDVYLSAYSALGGQVHVSEAVITAPKPVLPPGVCVPLNNLPLEHPACRFFSYRGFDPWQAAASFDVSFCISPNPELEFGQQRLVQHRIIFPIKYHGELKGWQARYVGPNGESSPPDKHVPKYFTAPNFRKSQYLYNFDYVLRNRPSYVVVVEGVMDVLRLPMAVACFGHTLSTTHVNMLSDVVRNGTLVILFDPDVQEKQRIMIRELSSLFARFVCLRLPDSRDPAEWTSTEDLTHFIGTECQRQGVPLLT